MRELAARSYFFLSLVLGRLLRSARYSKTRIVRGTGEPVVRKRRAFYAPPLVWMGNSLLKLLDAGVRVLPQREWEARERQIWEQLSRPSIRVEGSGTLILPRLPGETLATLLEDSRLERSTRAKAIELAVDALIALHAGGLTHGDAMAENVLVDLESGVAHWIDFETVHDARRPMSWRRADDVRALLATCLVRGDRARITETLHRILDRYRDEEVSRGVAASFVSATRRPLAFHLAQAGFPFGVDRDIARRLRERHSG